MYKIKLTAKAKRELKKLSQEDKLSIGESIEELKEDPLIGKSLDRELIRRYAYRIGVFRIVYLVNQKDKIITVLTAGYRRTVYN